MPPLKKFLPESIQAIARNPNTDLQSIGIYSKSDIQHHIRTQQFQELLNYYKNGHDTTTIKTYDNLQKQQDFQIFTHKVTADIFKTLNITFKTSHHYDMHLDMKLDYTISRIFQEMVLSELETLHQLCELERTQILQSIALAVLKVPYVGYLLSGNRSNFIDYEGNFLWYYTCTKKVSPLYVFGDKRSYKESPCSTKIKYNLLIHSQVEHIFGTQQYPVDQKTATALYN